MDSMKVDFGRKYPLKFKGKIMGSASIENDESIITDLDDNSLYYEEVKKLLIAKNAPIAIGSKSNHKNVLIEFELIIK